MHEGYFKKEADTNTVNQTNFGSDKEGGRIFIPFQNLFLSMCEMELSRHWEHLDCPTNQGVPLENFLETMFLMETKNQDEALFKLFQNSDLSNHFTVAPIGLVGGLSLSWRDDIQVEILYSSANVIDTIISAQEISNFVSFIYREPNPVDRSNFGVNWRN